MSDDTTRRERAEKYLNGPDPINFEDSRWARNLAGSCDDDYGVLVGYLAGAREEAAIKNAEIADLQSDVQLMAAPHKSVGSVGLALRLKIAEREATIRDLTDTITEMSVTLAERAEEIADSRKTAEHWKQEHLAGNEEIAKLQESVRLVESAIMRDLTESGESVTADLLAINWIERPEVQRAIGATNHGDGY